MSATNDRIVERRRPLPVAVRQRKLVDGEYILAPGKLDEMIEHLRDNAEGDFSRGMTMAVEFVDRHGEWL